MVRWASPINADAAAQGKWDDYPTYPTTKDKEIKEFCGTASSQLTLYRGKKGFASPANRAPVGRPLRNAPARRPRAAPVCDASSRTSRCLILRCLRT